MGSPKFSVVVPVYNQAEFLGEAIESVLGQTCPDFELIVVNDASPDNASEVVSQFTDARIRYCIHDVNRGLPAARNTGIRASCGEFIALLDADDIYHPEKLDLHLDFLLEHPDIGVSYNNRFELNYSSKTIRGIWRPPRDVTLFDLVRGFPFSPSDMVFHRECAFRVNLFHEDYICGGEDLDFVCRLALAGCKFASVDRALNYRTYHSGRLRKKLSCRLDDYTRALDAAFSDPHCPEEVIAIRSEAYASHYLEVAYYALLQGEIDLGQETLRRVIHLDPTLITGHPSKVISYLMNNIIKDENKDHEELMKQMVSHLPSEVAKLAEQCNWAVGRGYVLKGTRSIIWGRLEDGKNHFDKAKALGAQIDEAFLRQLVAQLLNYEAEFGPEATQEILQTLIPFLKSIGNTASTRWLKGSYYFNQGLNSYRAGEYSKVPGGVMRTIVSDPGYLFNRGMLAILSRSLVQSVLPGMRDRI